MDLNGKVAIVTGGGTGIGRAISRALAAGGARVVVNYSRSEAEAAETVAEIESAGGRAAALRADVSVAAEVHGLVERTVAELGRLDVLVNNAGFTRFVPMRDLDAMLEEDWDRIFDVNVKGTWLCARAAAEPMRRAGAGAIVNISSVAGVRVSGSSMAYAVSKAAIIHLTKCLAVALSPEIRVNSVAPGLVLTRWGKNFSEERIRQSIETVPLHRTVEPEEVATAVVETVRNDAMTGQTIAVDAGSLLI
jgi:3-oxoacyl-[acyl-carrier protein] reductase